IGERSSHTWFVLKYLLGYPNVRNYDGSWTEWGNLVRTPIEKPCGKEADSETVDVLAVPEPREAQLPFLLFVKPAVRPDPQSPGTLHSAKGPYVEARPGPRILPQLLESPRKALLNVLRQSGQLGLPG